MLAIATNTRSMRGSAVFQSLKSWVAALHPAAPLTPKESQRLLTALTGSFRRHLDETHPKVAAPDVLPKLGNGDGSTTRPRALHSSAAAADRHLSSILTNPLLNKGSPRITKADQDFANAKVELQKNHAKDPISLLEEYDAQGAATVAIANLCIQSFESSLVGLSAAQQEHAVAQAKPGRRTLSWLWRSKLHLDDTFINNLGFVDTLTCALLREEMDEFLWDWLKLDMPSALWKEHNPQGTRNPVKILLYRNRWKARILRAMVTYQLEGQKSNLDDALDVFFEAVKLIEEAPHDSHMKLLPTHAAESYLHANLTNKRHRLTNPTVDVERYDRFRKSFKQSALGKWDMRVRREDAVLDLYHPTKPTPFAMLAVIRTLFNEQPSQEAQYTLHDLSGKDGTKERANYWYSTFVRTITLLRREGCKADADWVRDQIWHVNPELARYTDNDVRKNEIAEGKVYAAEGRAKSTGASGMDRVPFPVFT